MALFPNFEDVVTQDWLKSAFENGTFDSDHGSSLTELCYEVKDNALLKNISIPEELKFVPDYEWHEHPFYQEKIFEHLQKEYGHICNQIQKSEFLTIYRKMNVDQKFIDNLSKNHPIEIGVYYSEDQYQDVDYWKKDEKEFDIRLKCEVKRKFVNWIDTFRMRMDYMTGGSEEEIRLVEFSPVHVIGWAGADDDLNDVMTDIKRWHSSGKAGQSPKNKEKENILEF